MRLFRNIFHSSCDRKERMLMRRLDDTRRQFTKDLEHLATSLEEQKAIVDYTLLEKEQLEQKLKEITEERDHFNEEVNSLLRDNLTAGTNITKLVQSEANLLIEVSRLKKKVKIVTDEFTGKGKKRKAASGKFKPEPFNHVEFAGNHGIIAQPIIAKECVNSITEQSEA